MNFVNFVKYPEKHANITFLNNNEKMIEFLNKIKIKKCLQKKEKITFKNKGSQRLYDSAPALPTIKTILNNPNKNYIIEGGIRVSARYPDYIVNKRDIIYLKKVLIKYGILKIPISNIKLVIEKCIRLVQEKLKTNLFNNIENTRWILFDTIMNNFRNMCLNVNAYSKYKNKLIPTNLSMLLYFTGDCREHRILLLYLMRIYMYYNDKNNTYLVESIYISGGESKLVNNKNIFVNGYYEHTFPILVNKTTQDIIALDALCHKTEIVPKPRRELMTYENIKSIKTKNDFYYINGYHTNNKLPFLFILVDWWTKTPCHYIENKILKNNVYLYGMKFKPINIKYVFYKKFNNLIIKRLYGGQFCNGMLKSTFDKITVNKKRNKTGNTIFKNLKLSY